MVKKGGTWGAIYRRRYRSGREVYRIRLFKRGYKSFNMTFDDLVEAKAWLKEHRTRFNYHPEYYFRWREKVYCKVIERERKERDYLLPKKGSRKRPNNIVKFEIKEFF